DGRHELRLDLPRPPTPAATVRAIAEGDRRARLETARLRDGGAPVVTFDELAAAAADPEAAPIRKGVELVGTALELCAHPDPTHVLLVESGWECAYGKPPGPERTVHVVLARGAVPHADPLRGRVVRVTGTLRRRTAPHPGVSSSPAAVAARFRMDATAIVPV